MAYIDLTQPIFHHMPVYPGDRQVELRHIESHSFECTISNHILTCSMHIGTHIDAPGHMIPGGKKLSEYPLERFIGPGILIDARGHKQIDADLLDAITLQKDAIVLIYTGWDKKFYEKEYFESYPALTQAFAEELIKAGIKMVGTDTPSPDYAPYLIHKQLLSHDILIIENLTQLSQLISYKTFEIIALPIKLETDGALARVIARV